PTRNAYQNFNQGGETCHGPPCQDAFVTKLNTNASGAASLLYSTYLGGSGDDVGNGVALDPSGNAYITGSTGSLGTGPTVIGILPDSNAFVTKIGADTDGDGLPDEWELNGVTIDGVFIDLPSMGADPLHKDLFVHADWMEPTATYKPKARAVQMIIDAFERAP